MPQQKLYNRRSVLAVMPCTKRPLPIILGSDPNKKNFLYCHGKSVIIRNIEQPRVADVYGNHTDIVTVARYSPNGRFIASADATGHLMIWGSFYDFHPLEKHFRPMNGVIKDLAWSPDSQRIVVAGKGMNSSGRLLSAETGAPICELTGCKKGNVTVDFRPKKAFRFVTGSEDHSVSFYEGPPFKFKFTKLVHNSVVNSVRYSPDGRFVASAGFDGMVILYDGKTGSVLEMFGKPAHKGVVTGISWSPDSSQILSSSEDGTCKIWDVTTNSIVKEFRMGDRKMDQQMACLWQDDFLLSVSLNGNINYLDANNPSKPIRVLKGHSDLLTGLTVLPMRKNNILTASEDGLINFWNTDTGESRSIEGEGHKGSLTDMLLNDKTIFTCGNDLCIRQINLDSKSFTKYWVKLNSKPIGLGLLKKDIMVVACQKKLFLVKDRAIIFALPINYHATCLATNIISNHVVVGGHDLRAHFYKADEFSLEYQYDLEHDFQINCCAFSPDYKNLVVCDSGGKVCTYTQKQGRYVKAISWSLTNDIVTAVAWSPNSTYVAAASMDYSITLQSTHNPNKQFNIVDAHGKSIVSRLDWLDEKTLVSIGQDGNTNVWTINT